VTAADLIMPANSEPSAAVAARVAQARVVQQERYASLGNAGILTNTQCTPALIERVVALEPKASSLLSEAAETLRLSARGYHRVLKVARTLADLDGAGTVGRIHLAEALSYRAAGDPLRAAA
jgi:magnesium chelatase family protein